ncbi:ABC transporter permease [[Clostridium] hylemonae]|uniref:Branched-chain amino acid ABC transporter, permease protein n=1 Tax=[Clostridium] hylemonae DSM 15053 TaxID=553973 RepID=C0C034_9FIRM|nr:ABC transporter permease [[Clostridium] hylemonae]EEG74762.1 branched-chain amino acid ABC transporter, permease protein [[Clostridium] hylemonae DSM 15053]QEK18776.1 Autoinducer 2 import system permease protein LsrD [[Clostridium] hylemonae DSM 15053]
MKLKVQRHQTLIISYLTALVLFAAISVYKPGFASIDHIRVLCSEAAIIGVVAIGQTFVIITGGIDLSVAWMVGIAAIMITNVTKGLDESLAWAVPFILVLTTCFGLVNGICIAYLNMPPIVMTLGMNTVLQGGLVAVTQGAPGGAAPAFIKKMGQSSFLGIPYLIIIWAVLAAVVTVLLFKMKYGRELFAVGNNATVAAYSGINVRRVTLTAYAVSGLTAGIAGMLLAGKVGQSYLGIGDNFQFQSIAAVAIGGTSLMGGNGNYLGTVAGAFTITIILGILAALNLPFGVQKMAYGIVVLASVLMSVRKGLRK